MLKTGRWTRPNSIPFDQRVYKACLKLEDEFYFFLERPIYVDLKNTYIKRYYANRPSMVKLTELLRSKIKKTLSYLRKMYLVKLKSLLLCQNICLVYNRTLFIYYVYKMTTIYKLVFTRLTKELLKLKGVWMPNVILFNKFSSVFFKIHTRHNIMIFIADITIA